MLWVVRLPPFNTCTHCGPLALEWVQECVSRLQIALLAPPGARVEYNSTLTVVPAC